MCAKVVMIHGKPEIQRELKMSANLSARVKRANKAGNLRGMQYEDLGVISVREVTDAFVAALVDTLQSSVAAFSDFKFHDSGTGVVAEDQTDTALGTPTGVARTSGSQIEGATANIYKSVGEITYDGAYAITEHGLFNIDAAGILMDRSVFGAINVGNGDKIEFTYQLTCTSGG